MKSHIFLDVDRYGEYYAERMSQRERDINRIITFVSKLHKKIPRLGAGNKEHRNAEGFSLLFLNPSVIFIGMILLGHMGAQFFSFFEEYP